jgi:hypothetical protein
MVYLEFINKFTVSSLAVFVILIPLILSLSSYSYLDKAFRLLLTFLCIDLIIGLWMFHLAAYRSNNILLLNIFVPMRYMLLGGMFIHYFHSNRNRQIIFFSIIAFIPFTIIDVYTSNENLADLHNHMVGRYSQVVESVLMILWVLLYFYEIIKSMVVKNITSYPFFWVCAGLLFFYSGNIFKIRVDWKDSLRGRDRFFVIIYNWNMEYARTACKNWILNKYAGPF